MREMLLAYTQVACFGTRNSMHKRYWQIFPHLAWKSPAMARSLNLVEPLTAREIEILQLMAEGCSNRQIAEKLILAEGTVKFYVHAVLVKLGVHSRTQAVFEAKKQKII